MEKPLSSGFARRFIRLPSSWLLGTICFAIGSAQASETIEEIVVIGTKQERYMSFEASLGGMNIDVFDFPRSVSVIPEQVLIDQQVQDLDEALLNVAGVTLGDGFGGTLTDFVIRGFRRDAIYRNGVRLPQATNNKPPVQNIETLELIKGPGSVFFGQVEPGGLVNISTKLPRDEPRAYLQASFDEHGRRRGSFDVTGPINDQLAYRLNGSLDRSDTFRDFSEIEGEFLSPSLRWKASNATTAYLTYEYFTDNRPVDRGFVSLPDEEGGRTIPDLPRSRRLGEPFEERDSEVHLVDVAVEHRLDDRWRVRAGALWRSEDEFDIQVRPRSVDTAGNLARRVDGTNDREIEILHLSVRLDGEFETGRVRHKLSLGVDRQEVESDRFFSVGPTAFRGFNIFDPVFGLIEDERTPPGDPRVEDEEFAGVFLHDQMFMLDDRLVLLVGGRYDRVDGDVLFAGRERTLDKQDKFSPQLGLLYHPTPDTAVYASWAQGFNPQFNFDPFRADVFPPTESEQFEIGAKAQLFEGRLNGELSLYDLTKDNIVETLTDGSFAFVGEVRSRGVEATGIGQVLPGLNVIVSYAYTDNEILSEESANPGNRLSNVAKHTFRAWGSYEVRDGRWAGLGFGLGADYTSDRFGDSSNTWTLGSYTKADAAVWYYLPLNGLAALPSSSPAQLRLGLNLKNIFDERYFPAAGEILRINVGQPRTLLFSVALDF